MKQNNYITPETEVTELMQMSALCKTSGGDSAEVEGPIMPGGSNEDPFAGMFPATFRRKPIIIRR